MARQTVREERERDGEEREKKMESKIQGERD